MIAGFRLFYISVINSMNRLPRWQRVGARGGAPAVYPARPPASRLGGPGYRHCFCCYVLNLVKFPLVDHLRFDHPAAPTGNHLTTRHDTALSERRETRSPRALPVSRGSGVRCLFQFEISGEIVSAYAPCRDETNHIVRARDRFQGLDPSIGLRGEELERLDPVPHR